MIRDGRILAVGTDVDVPTGAEVIDATGRHVYEGMFDPVTTLGLTEVGAVDVTNDSREQGDKLRSSVLMGGPSRRCGSRWVRR